MNEDKVYQLEKELNELKHKYSCLVSSEFYDIEKKNYEILIERQEKYIHILKNANINVAKAFHVSNKINIFYE